MRKTYKGAAICLLSALPTIAQSADYTVATGTIDNGSKSLKKTDRLTVQAGGALSVDDTAIKWKDASTGIVIDNSGTIESTASDDRAINASGDVTAPRSIQLINRAGATIKSESDAFRINTDITTGTVNVQNAGTVLSTVDGQALDFDAVQSTGTPGATINIVNSSSGLIEAMGADAIRPGQGATITNSGTIRSNGVAGDKNDGIDFQAHSGTVYNMAGGVISGQRHGITTDADETVYNYGSITGRNGSGVGSDGNGTVFNHGTITGAYDGSGTGDGDGVDIDNVGYVENWGTIQGTGAAGLKSDGINANQSEGVAITSNATIINHAGATIYAPAAAISTVGTATVLNDGVIVSDNHA